VGGVIGGFVTYLRKAVLKDALGGKKGIEGGTCCFRPRKKKGYHSLVRKRGTCREGAA